MRTHGWAGRPPQDDDEARARILAATRACLTATPGAARTVDVAEALGVTRQTVYRYYPSTEDLLNAAAMDAVVELQHDLTAHVRRHLAAGADAGDVVVEVVAFVYEHLRDDPALNRLLAPGRIAGTLAGLTAPSSIVLGGSLLADFGVDWAGLGWDAERQRELVEHLLRTLQSLVLDPGDPERSGSELRGYLSRWIAPSVRWLPPAGIP